MQREGSWRLYLIAAITVISVLLLAPTFRYFLYISGERPVGEIQGFFCEKGAHFQTREDLGDGAPSLCPEHDSALVEMNDLEAWLAKSETMRLKAIPLGLDIQGGVDVVLEVDLQKAMDSGLKLRGKRIRESFSLEGINASLEYPEDAPVLDIEVKDPEDYRRAANLLQDNYERVFAKWDAKTLESTGKVRLTLDRDVVESEAEETIEGAEKVIRERVDAFGVVQASVSRQGQSRIRVQIPGEKDPQRVVKNIIKPAILKFYLVHEQSAQLRSELFENEGVIPADQPSPPAAEGESPKPPVVPLLEGKMLPDGYIALPGESPGDDDTAEGGKPPRVMWVVAEDPEMTGENLDNAFVRYQTTDLENPIVVDIEFNKEGGRDFFEITREHCRRGDKPGRQLAIALDDVIFSAPELREEIPNGRAVISGHFNNEDAKELSLVLKAGALPADLKPGEGRTVEATLGADSIAASLRALLLGACVVVVFMVVYYSMAGVIAVFALILNILIILSIMKLAHATLTLSGIGGILLTVGMAVDANVLIYERIREEIRAGKPIKAALAAGFNRAFSVILDSNLTTLLTALVLLQFGEGSVRGFALTMTFGLLANLYTGLAVTYALCAAWFSWRGKLSLGVLRFLTNPKIDFIRLRFGAFAFSGLLIVLSLGVLIQNRGPNFAVDFAGGVLSEVVFVEDYPAGDIDRALDSGGVPGTRTQKYGDVQTGHEALIRAPLLENDILRTEEKIASALTETFGAEGFDVRGSQSFTSEIGQEFSGLARVVILSAAFAILAYLWFRFELTFGVAAVVALIHDLFLTLGLVTILKIDISLDVVSAFLILLGYSANDTIVIFDRLRENARDPRGRDLKTLCNDSMNSSLTRTVITSLTTIFVMSCMCAFGGHTLRPFATTLIVGMFFGTYSSSFVASPFVYEWTMRRRGGSLALTQQTVAATGRPGSGGRGGRKRGNITARAPGAARDRPKKS
jgi:SecD/SecF fusion protein